MKHHSGESVEEGELGVDRRSQAFEFLSDFGAVLLQRSGDLSLGLEKLLALLQFVLDRGPDEGRSGCVAIPADGALDFFLD